VRCFDSYLLSSPLANPLHSSHMTCKAYFLTSCLNGFRLDVRAMYRVAWTETVTFSQVLGAVMNSVGAASGLGVYRLTTLSQPVEASEHLVPPYVYLFVGFLILVRQLSFSAGHGALCSPADTWRFNRYQVLLSVLLVSFPPTPPPFPLTQFVEPVADCKHIHHHLSSYKHC
jgi:hypothetical protein